MTGRPRDPRPERDDTDLSLDVERRKAEDELLSRSASTERDQDQTVRLARLRAAAILGEPHGVALRAEHAADDAKRAAVWIRHRAAISAIFELERAETDRNLLTERTLADHAVVAREDFLGMVAHDARGLLTGVSMQAAMLVRRAADDAAGREIIHRADAIAALAAQINRLLSDLLDVASIEAGKLRCVAEPHDLGTTVSEVVELFQPTATARQLVLAAEPPEQPLRGRFDPERISQVLTNLIANAIKFTDPGGRIEVQLGGSHVELRCSVTDTGRGIPRDELPRVFERGWQTPHGHAGLGLGLYISRCIVEAHAGRIWADSEPGHGATFHFTLPAV